MSSADTIRSVPPDAPAASASDLAAEVAIRPLSSDRDLRACVEIQHQVWGEGFSECVPPTILKVCQRIGGVAAGAFVGDRLLGFVFGMTGVERGDVVHWSDMLAVRPEARNLGLGRRLKQYQAETLRELGVRRIYWTYDPLVARNAYLNLTKLGAEVVEYVVDMYGDTDSELHRIGTDRFIVRWSLAEGEGTERWSAPVSGGAEDAPILNDGDGGGDGGVGELTAPVVRVQVPLDIDAVRRASLEQAIRWRDTTREAFVVALGQGYRVSSFARTAEAGPCYYVLTRGGDGREGGSS